MMLKRWFLVAMAVAALFPGVVTAQQQGAPVPEDAAGQDMAAPPPSWGLTSLTVASVDSWAFEPFDSATVNIGDGLNRRFVTSGNTCFEAPVYLPNGAIIDHVELDACDTDGANNVSSALFICNTAGTCPASYQASTSGTPGCGRVSSAVGSTVVNNNANMYTQQVCTGGLGNTLRFQGTRVFYRLQVSPAPGTATFSDVPVGSGQHRFVEALVAAGITGGCGGGLYCPNDPVTRGQMAVFLAAALGLHFPN